MTEEKKEYTLDAFRRRHTQLWIPDLPTHCMSWKYQNLDSDSWPFSGVPSRYLSSSANEFSSDSDFNGSHPLNPQDPTIEDGISRVTRKRHSEYAKHHEGGRPFLADLVYDTREQMTRYLESRGPVDLERLMKDMTSRLEAYVATIDKEYVVVKPRSREDIRRSLEKVKKYPDLEGMYNLSRETRTTRLEEARSLLFALRNSKYHRPGALLQDILPNSVVTGDCRWRLRAGLSPSIEIACTRPQRPGYGFIGPMNSFARDAKCVSLPSWGYHFGISHFPVDLTLDQAELIVELYYTDLKNRADRLCESHALLYFRTVMAGLILQEYSLHGEIKTWTREAVEKSAHKISSVNMGRPIHARAGKKMEDRRKPLLAALSNPDHWHSKGPHKGKPKWTDIAAHLGANHEGLFMDPKKRGMPLTSKRVADIAREDLEIDLESIRKELGVPHA